MNIRKRLEIPKSVSAEVEFPAWVNNGTKSTKPLFESALKEFNRIHLLLNSNAITEKSECKIILGVVAEYVKKDRSVLSKRRQPDLYLWIEEKNAELAALFDAKNSKQKPLKKKPIAQLESEVAKLRRELKSQKENQYRLIVEEFFSSNILDERDKLARENSRMKIDNQNLIDQIARLQHENRNLTNRLNNCFSVLTPEQRIAMGSIKLL